MAEAARGAGPAGWVGTMSSAGHEPPLILRQSGAVEAPAACGRMLGVGQDAVLSDTSFVLDRGDALVLVTDGVTGAGAGSGGELFGDGQLAEVLATRCRGYDATDTDGGVMTAVSDHARGYCADDTAVMVPQSVRAPGIARSPVRSHERAPPLDPCISGYRR